MTTMAVAAGLFPKSQIRYTEASQPNEDLFVKTRVLFLSMDNACRSQMAEGLVNHCLGERVAAFSAGLEPTSIHPQAVAAMAEIGIDISGQHAKEAEEFSDERFDYVICLLGELQERCLFGKAVSYCGRCGGNCPHLEPRRFGGEPLQLLGIPDPARVKGDEETVMAAFRQVRERIKAELWRFFAGKEGG